MSGIVTSVLSAGNETGDFHGTAVLIANLRGNRTVTDAKFSQTPICITDDGYAAALDGNAYFQVKEPPNAVYVDGTGATEGAYRTLEEAVAALPNDGGTVIV